MALQLGNLVQNMVHFDTVLRETAASNDQILDFVVDMNA